MECPKCGAKVNDGDNFCEECGASLKQFVLKSSFTEKAFPESLVEVCDNTLAAATNVGRKHPINEDAATVLRCENGDSILIVADGVSSSVGAISASNRAIEVIKEVLLNNSEKDTPKDVIISAVDLADTSIKALPFEDREDGAYGPETTVVTALVKGDTATIGWVGDSRAYVIKENSQEILTIDDSWVEYVVEEGIMTKEAASLDRRSHCVTQVLGMHDQETEIHITERKLEEGDILLLCSDGLWNYFKGEAALLNTIICYGRNSDAADICKQLVGLANAAGGHDNITAAILKK